MIREKTLDLVNRFAPGVIARNAGASIHVAVSVPLTSAAVYFMGAPWFLVAIVNAVAWLVRENTQTDKKLKYWSTHKHIEWIAPSLTGTIASYVTYLLI
jgi:hypothetical protein